MNAAAILRRWDNAAYEQLCAEAVRLTEENEQLRDQLYWAEQAAESWREDALQMMEEACAATGRQPGITMSGALVTVPVEARA